VQGFDQDSSRRPTQRDDPFEQLVDQLVRKLAHEVALPVVAVLAVRRIDQAQLFGERLLA
jgi:hypothetical protein